MSANSPGIPIVGDGYVVPGQDPPRAARLPSEQGSIDLKVVVAALIAGRKRAQMIGQPGLRLVIDAITEFLVEVIEDPDGDVAQAVPKVYEQVARVFRQPSD